MAGLRQYPTDQEIKESYDAYRKGEQALAEFIRSADAPSSAVLDRFIERNKAFIRRVSPAQLRRRLRIEPVGRHHDLLAIFTALNRRYFAGRIAATITFGPAPRSRRPRKSIKMGSYSADSRVIRIHPALDQPKVPRYFVEWIVFHEMLHHVYRARAADDGRRCVHPPEFMQPERRFQVSSSPVSRPQTNWCSHWGCLDTNSSPSMIS